MSNSNAQELLGSAGIYFEEWQYEPTSKGDYVTGRVRKYPGFYTASFRDSSGDWRTAMDDNGDEPFMSHQDAYNALGWSIACYNKEDLRNYSMADWLNGTLPDEVPYFVF